MTGVVLPDGTKWRFDYDSSSINYGDLVAVYPPTGGHISYSWGWSGYPCSNTYDLGTRGVVSRTVYDGANSNTWKYTWAPGTSSIYTVTDPTQPVGNDTVYNSSGSCGTIGKVLYYSGPAATGTLLKTVNKAYRDLPNPYPCDLNYLAPDPQLLSSITTTWPNGQQSQVQMTYDSGFTFADINWEESNYNYCPGASPYTSSYGLVTSESHSDYGSGAPGPVLSTTKTNYLPLTNPSYVTANILDLPSSIITTDGSGNKCAETDYGYDESAVDPSGVTQQHVAAPNPVRGNLTSVTRQLFTNPCSSPNPSSTPLTTTYHVFDTGMKHTVTDPLLHTTTYAYSPTYFGAFPTTVTNALNQSATYAYDFNTGLMTSMTDANSQTASYSWDSMLRLSQANSPDGGQQTFTPIYTGGYFTGYSSSKKIATSPTAVNLNSTQLFDGLGRLKETQLNSDPDGTTYSDTTYDAVGRKYKVWNPTRCFPAQTNCGESTWGFATYNYDALNRVSSVVEQDGSTVASFYTGSCTAVTDEAQKSRMSCSDGLGRMTGVWEDPYGLNYRTSYTYNALDNLQTVLQNGSRPRTFVYDSLSRLASATNPESGTIGYSYDANGNLATKTSPAPNQTGSATVTLTYCYDALNRLTAKAYTLQTCTNGTLPTPVATYLYDQSTSNGLTITNGIGRRTGMTDQAGAEAWAYDPMGRVLFEKRTTNSLSKTIPYTYNLDGSLLSVSTPTAPNGGNSLTYTYQPGGAGRTLSVNSTLLQNAHYTPNGQLCYLQGNWNGVWTSASSFNNRLQPATFYALDIFNGGPTPPPPCVASPLIPGSGYVANALDLSYNYVDANGHNNGNVMSITNVLDATRSQNFTYDALNRLATAQTGSTHATSAANCWAKTYGYDAWGNLTSLGPNSATQSAYIGCLQESGLSTTATAQNRLAFLNYDSAGNVIGNPGVANYFYDAENRICSVSGTSCTTGTYYTYDGDGRRVMKSSGTIYWYGMNSDALMETDLANNDLSAYIFMNGKRVGRQLPTNEVDFYFTDALGTSRYVYSLAGANVSDYYPFGGERVISTGTPNHYKFTGKERDSESGLDEFGARYYSSQYGRFMTPDPLTPSRSHRLVLDQFVADPQNWNKYAYSLNNPVTYRDVGGHFTGDDHERIQISAMLAHGYSAAAAQTAATANRAMDHGTWMPGVPGFNHLTSSETQNKVNPQHGESGEHQTRQQAQAAATAFMSAKISGAAEKALQGDVRGALADLGSASHTAQDIVRHNFESGSQHPIIEAPAAEAESRAATKATSDVLDQFVTDVYDLGMSDGLSFGEIGQDMANVLQGPGMQPSTIGPPERGCLTGIRCNQ